MECYEKEIQNLIELARNASSPEEKESLYAGANALMLIRKLSRSASTFTGVPDLRKLQDATEECLQWQKIPSSGHDMNTGYRVSARYEFEQQAQPEAIMELFRKIDQYAKDANPIDCE